MTMIDTAQFIGEHTTNGTIVLILIICFSLIGMLISIVWFAFKRALKNFDETLVKVNVINNKLSEKISILDVSLVKIETSYQGQINSCSFFMNASKESINNISERVTTHGKTIDDHSKQIAKIEGQLGINE